MLLAIALLSLGAGVVSPIRRGDLSPRESCNPLDVHHYAGDGACLESPGDFQILGALFLLISAAFVAWAAVRATPAGANLNG
jgi:hypothetical protein